MNNFFVIRHKASGQILSQTWMKGASHWEPPYKTQDSPRLFHSKRAAQSFVSQWARGAVIKRFKPGGIFGHEEEIYLEYEHRGRHESQLEIVSITYTLGEVVQ